MLKDKLKALLLLSGVTQKDLCEHYNISKQQQSNKINNASYKLNELVELAILTNTKLAFIDENNNPVVIFNEEDIKNRAYHSGTLFLCIYITDFSRIFLSSSIPCRLYLNVCTSLLEYADLSKNIFHCFLF